MPLCTNPNALKRWCSAPCTTVQEVSEWDEMPALGRNVEVHSSHPVCVQKKTRKRDQEENMRGKDLFVCRYDDN